MKHFLFKLLLPLFIFTFASAGIFLKPDNQQDRIIYESIENSTLTNLSPIFKQSTEKIIQKLNVNNINVRNSEQTILQIALSNAKETSEILDIILFESEHRIIN